MKREIPAVSFPRQKPEPANKIRQQSRPALQTLNSAHKPVAPAVYRPQPLPKVLQPKTTAKQPANASIATKRNVPVAPPVYRPATVAKTVLAMKDRKQESNPKSGAGPGFHSRPVGVTGPQKVSVTQLKTSPKAPPVYRPNPVPKVLQPKTIGNPPRSISPASRTMKKVIQPYFTINDYPTTSTDTVFNRPYGLETKKLLRHDLLKDLHRGWKKYLEELVKSDKEEGPFVSVAELKNRLSVRFPPMDESQRRKAEKKREIKRRNKDNLDRVEKPKTMRGRKVRTGSFVASKKLVESIKATTTFQENEQTLTTTFQATALGQTHELTTGNYFQSALVFYQSTLPQNATGVRLEGHYHRVNEGQGAPGQIPTNPFLQTDLRLRRTQTHGDGSYQIDEVVDSPSLDALEMVRFLENIVSVSGRYVLYQQGQITQIQLHNPVGVYALHEVPKATTGCPRTNALLNQNTTAIIEALKSLPPDTIIGQHAGSFPDSTKMATVKSFIDALEAVEREHNKETQNEYHRQMFRISRAQVGPIITQSGEKEVPGTPPGSPFNPDYGYDKNL